VKKKATDLEYERSCVSPTRCIHDKVKRCLVMLAIFTSSHPGKRRDSAINTCPGPTTFYRLRLILQKQRYGVLLDTYISSGSSALMKSVLTVYVLHSTEQKPKVYCCSCKHRFANHTVVATADGKGAVITINICVYLETVLLNKQEVIHEYAYT